MNNTSPLPLTFKAVDTKIVNIGEEVSFKAELSPNGRKLTLAENFLAVEICRAIPDDTFDSKEGVTLIENG